MSLSRTTQGEEIAILQLRLAEPETRESAPGGASSAAAEMLDDSILDARDGAGRPVVFLISRVIVWNPAVVRPVDRNDCEALWTWARDASDAGGGANGTERLALKGARRSFGWESLRESELGIAELVAHGLTNREIGARLFLSRHTVDSHLRHIFWKLGINSRVELTRLVVEHGVTPGLRTGVVRSNSTG